MHGGLGRRRQGCWMIDSWSKEVKSENQTTNQDEVLSGGRRGRCVCVWEHTGEGLYTCFTSLSFSVVLLVYLNRSILQGSDFYSIWGGDGRRLQVCGSHTCLQLQSQWIVRDISPLPSCFRSFFLVCKFQYVECALSHPALLELDWWGKVMTATLTSTGQ